LPLLFNVVDVDSNLGGFIFCIVASNLDCKSMAFFGFKSALCLQPLAHQQTTALPQAMTMVSSKSTTQGKSK
jgi:hypothetical protein